jgi:hypothetical protein
MIKKYSFFLYISLVSCLLMQYHGCSSDPISSITGNPPLFGGFHQGDAAVMMTLSAISYTASGNTNAMQIRDSINLQLQDSNYATGGNWKVAWGPGISPTGSNLIFVAVDSTSDSLSYSICARGTTFNIANIIEDLDVLTMLKWPFSGSSDSVASGSLYALDTVLNTSDPVTNLSLQAYLNTLVGDKQKMYITGHSLGGALATMLTSWFVDMGFTSKFKLAAYTYAAPTVGNASFVSSYHNKMLATGSQSHRCVNSNDLVPYAWAGLQSVIDNNIPTILPLFIKVAIQTVENYLRDSGIVYKHVETKQDLGTENPVNCPNDSSISNYECWVEFEHSSNTYLRLLNADTINWGGSRPVSIGFDFNRLNSFPVKQVNK